MDDVTRRQVMKLAATASAVGLAAIGSGTADAQNERKNDRGKAEEEDRKSGKSFESQYKNLKDKEEIEKAAKRLEENTIKLKTGGGAESAEHRLDRSQNVTGAKDDFLETFIVPAGYRATTFSKSVEPRGSAGGSASWVNSDPHDAQIKIHIWADAFSKVTVKVWDVLAVKE